MSVPSHSFNLFNVKDPKIRTLHFTWVAFFISFMVWFNHAPLLKSIQASLGLSQAELSMLLTLNVALTIPARVLVGMAVDHFGPRLIYSGLLFTGGLLCFAFASAQSFEALAVTRFLLGFIGAGFVIGIRLVGEWFPARHVGAAEGVYGGWGNFGSAAAASSLPILALYFGGDEGWRWAVATTGLIAIVYSGIFYWSVRNTPRGSTYFRPKKGGAMEVTSRGDFFLYLVMLAPLVFALALLTWKLGPSGIALLSGPTSYFIYAFLVGLYLYQVYHAWAVNGHVFKQDVAQIHRYSFRQVAVLDLAYLATFGAELAVVSMLPLFFIDTFDLSMVEAGILASSFAFMNLVARPGGGLFSDRFGRKPTLFILLIGAALGFLGMSQITSNTWLPFAVGITMACSFFVQAGEGAVFAMVPLVKRRLTGQVAGQVGAYGNVGAVCFLTMLSMVSPSVFFLVLTATAVGTAIIILVALKTPEGQTAEEMPDGTLSMIDVV